MPFIAEVITQIRDETDEPSTNAKYTDAKLVNYISKAFSCVWNDINRVSKHVVVVQFDITVTTDKSTYVLPPTAGRIIDLQWIATDGTTIYQYFNTSSHKQPTAPGMVLDGNTIRFQTTPPDAFTLRVLFAPSGLVHLHYGTDADSVTSITNSTSNENCVIVVKSAPTAGTRDLRDNAYAGCIFRLLTAGVGGAGMIQDRVIRAYDPQTYTFTVAPEYETADLPTVTGATYEITPLMADDLAWPVSLYVSRHLVALEGDRPRYSLINTEYNRAIREVRLREALFDTIRGSFMNVSTIRSPHVINAELGRIDTGLRR